MPMLPLEHTICVEAVIDEVVHVKINPLTMRISTPTHMRIIKNDFQGGQFDQDNNHLIHYATVQCEAKVTGIFSR